MRYIIIPLLIALYIYAFVKSFRELKEKKFKLFNTGELTMAFTMLHIILLGGAAVIGILYFIVNYW